MLRNLFALAISLSFLTHCSTSQDERGRIPAQAPEKEQMKAAVTRGFPMGNYKHLLISQVETEAEKSGVRIAVGPAAGGAVAKVLPISGKAQWEQKNTTELARVTGLYTYIVAPRELDRVLNPNNRLGEANVVNNRSPDPSDRLYVFCNVKVACIVDEQSAAHFVGGVESFAGGVDTTIGTAKGKLVAAEASEFSRLIPISQGKLYTTRDARAECERFRDSVLKKLTEEAANLFAQRFHWTDRESECSSDRGCERHNEMEKLVEAAAKAIKGGPPPDEKMAFLSFNRFETENEIKEARKAYFKARNQWVKGATSVCMPYTEGNVTLRRCEYRLKEGAPCFRVAPPLKLDLIERKGLFGPVVPIHKGPYTYSTPCAPGLACVDGTCRSLAELCNEALFIQGKRDPPAWLKDPSRYAELDYQEHCRDFFGNGVPILPTKAIDRETLEEVELPPLFKMHVPERLKGKLGVGHGPLKDGKRPILEPDDDLLLKNGKRPALKIEDLDPRDLKLKR